MAPSGTRVRFAIVLIGMTATCGRAGEPAIGASPLLTNTLAVQDAMRQGRDLLQRGQNKAAVEALESHIARINGNPAYLALLREAYSAYIKDLQIQHQDGLLAIYEHRLQVIDQGASSKAIAQVHGAADKMRAVSADDPFQQTPRRADPADRAKLVDAERAFAARQFLEANSLFSRAAVGGPALSIDQRKQWAYCRLYAVVERLKEPGATSSDLEREIAATLKIADNDASLSAFARQILDRLQRRAGPAAMNVAIRHLERDANGWARAESASFRLHYGQQRELAEQVLRAAEQARMAAFDRWAGPPRGDWSPICNIYLYATAADYAKATGQAIASPGHATYKGEGGAVTARRLDLRADEPNLLTCVVPHETTHLVLGDLFPQAPLPRWADEGMAVLAEPRSRIDRFTRTLHTCRQRGQLVPLEKLLARVDYPGEASVTVFFVESVSVVEFLVGLNGPRAFTDFLRDTQRGNLEAALQKHYQCPTVAELQARWLRKTYPAETARAASAP